ncbi:unnamed protein product [Lepidochelys kempii]
MLSGPVQRRVGMGLEVTGLDGGMDSTPALLLLPGSGGMTLLVSWCFLNWLLFSCPCQDSSHAAQKQRRQRAVHKDESSSVLTLSQERGEHNKRGKMQKKRRETRE